MKELHPIINFYINYGDYNTAFFLMKDGLNPKFGSNDLAKFTAEQKSQNAISWGTLAIIYDYRGNEIKEAEAIKMAEKLNPDVARELKNILNN
jgi:hypothetical protein